MRFLRGTDWNFIHCLEQIQPLREYTRLKLGGRQTYDRSSD
jgi:hypothetical protein